MRNAVVIKSSKAGMTVILDPELPFGELLEAIGKKFSESARFWGSVQMTLTLEGRDLTAAQEFAIVDTITKNSQIEVLCLLDTDAERIERCEKALNDKLMELNSQTGQFYRGTLKRGDCLESEASIVLIGNVDHGARVTAKGNVVVLGELKGTVTAGVSGNPQAIVMALDMAPLQIRIGDLSSRFNERNKRLGRGPMIALVEDRAIVMRSLKKSFLNNMLNFA
ncbi:septum site-determining protein MinC [Enterocloster clostridioformis]|uniref:septum site-determining protein MinC n=1 Tax=Enterocloster clostridioformis TaxID=1531 RepID=UPI0004134071|nr:septum site-determining protein MinC [Enterocloster clostridioformis]